MERNKLSTKFKCQLRLLFNK